MDIFQFIKYLNKTKGWHIEGSYYSRINEWRQWYEGDYPSFHTIRESSLTGKIISRPMYRLRMPKHICEDWASLLLTDKTIVTIPDQRTATWLCGDPNAQQTGGILGDLDFWVNANNLVEKAFRSGTGAFLLSASGVKIDNGSFTPTPTAALHLDYLPAECILPLTIRHGKILETAFASEVTEGGKSCIYLQTHQLVNGQYKITNEYFTSDNEDSQSADYRTADLPSGMQKSFLTGSNIPWFALFSPAEQKNIRGGPGMGMAVFSEAIDAVKMCDLAFDNYCRDLYLGGKKVFYDRSLVKTSIDSSGNITHAAPDDVRQQLFVQPEGFDPDKAADWHEYNPSLRTEENSRAVQDALDYTSFKTGLGTHHYQFNSGNVATATQYTGDRQDMIQHAERHHIHIEDALLQIFRTLLWAGKNLLGADVDPDADISIGWDDSYIMDAQTRRAQDKDDALSGFIPKYRYNMEWRGMSEEDARQAVQETQQEQRSVERMMFGEE